MYYDWKDLLLLYLRSISHNYLYTLSTLHIPMKEQYNILDENNRRESIEYVRSVSIRTQYTTYDYKDVFWDSN